MDRAEAEAELNAEVLYRLLTLKFGALPEHVRHSLAQASEIQLDCWAAWIFAAEALEDVTDQAS